MADRRRRRKKKQGGKAILALLGVVVLFAVCIGGAYTLFAKNSQYINPTPNPLEKTIVATTTNPHDKNSQVAASTTVPKTTKNPSSTSTPKATKAVQTEAPTKAPEAIKNSEVDLYTYENTEYGFECPYPSNFSEYSGNDPTAAIAYRSPDGAAYEHIFAGIESYGSPSMDMRDFVSSYPTAQIIQNRAGNDYFYALIKYDDMYIYRYTDYSGDVAKGFEFGYSERLESVYADYPEEIKSYFTIFDME